MNFLIQRMTLPVDYEQGKLAAHYNIHDFSYELLNCTDYMNWHKEKIQFRFTGSARFPQSCIANPDEWIPVGSVEFVSEYLKAYYPKAAGALRPLNVPEPLFLYAGRSIADCRSEEDFKKFSPCIPGYSKGTHRVYRKSLKTIKDPSNGLIQGVCDPSEYKGYQVSNYMDILSEWRIFVFHGKVLDCRNYSGDFFTYPNPEVIKEAVDAYGDQAPVAYTLDMGVVGPDKATVVIECHRFFSCGLYGFSNPGKYPYMLSQAWHEIIKNNK